MSLRLLKQTVIALTVGAVAVQLAHATDSDDDYKSSYPQLHQLSQSASTGDVDYKSSYAQLHAVLANHPAAPLAIDDPFRARG